MVTLHPLCKNAMIIHCPNINRELVCFPGPDMDTFLLNVNPHMVTEEMAAKYTLTPPFV